ncbi:MAG: phosphotransferase family protein [Kofleriaceae bacterium]
MDTSSLRPHLQALYPTHRVVAIEPMGPDAGPATESTSKAAGYGQPIHVSLVGPDGTPLELVWRTANADELGHDRRSDRASQALLAFDDFGNIPGHVAPLDVGVVRRTGELVSIRDYDELYLLTPYARGVPYAQDLRQIAESGIATERDHERVRVLARYLATLHTPISDPQRYRRAIRDLVGSGEGIFGVIDAYPESVSGAPPARLEAIERRCAPWRWRLRYHEGRLARIHGDFHPFNILFQGDELVLLDASRGTAGDPADDLAALAINFILFALDTNKGWKGLGPLWYRLWQTYAEEHHDPSLGFVIPPFLAWRALVVCNPKFYPNLSGPARSSLLSLVECMLETDHFDPGWADELFR